MYCILFIYVSIIKQCFIRSNGKKIALSTKSDSFKHHTLRHDFNQLKNTLESHTYTTTWFTLVCLFDPAMYCIFIFHTLNECVHHYNSISHQTKTKIEYKKWSNLEKQPSKFSRSVSVDGDRQARACVTHHRL